MKNRHIGRFGYLDATFRLFKSRNQNHFSLEDILGTYNVLAPPRLKMSRPAGAAFLNSYGNHFGVTKDHKEKRTSSTGAHEVVIWTWR